MKPALLFLWISNLEFAVLVLLHASASMQMHDQSMKSIGKVKVSVIDLSVSCHAMLPQHRVAHRISRVCWVLWFHLHPRIRSESALGLIGK